MTRTSSQAGSVAVVTGASRGFGRAVARALSERGWRLVLDARAEADLHAVGDQIPSAVLVSGDVTDPAHRAAVVEATTAFGRVDLLVNNASELGPSPLPALADYPIGALREVLEVNVIAPLALTQLLLPALRASGGAIVNVSSDAAVQAYAGWGGYGSSKAGLDQLSAVLAAEEDLVRVYAVDPGDMRTGMHQRAFPGEDISDRLEPEAVVPSLLRLLEARPPSGRHRLADWPPERALPA